MVRVSALALGACASRMAEQLVTTCLVLTLSACGTPAAPDAPPTDGVATAKDTGDSSAEPDTSVTDASDTASSLTDAADSSATDAASLDVGDVSANEIPLVADGGPDAADANVDGPDGSCSGQTGCGCAKDGDCSSGICAETATGWQCASLCGAGCPVGTACRSTSQNGQTISYCAPQGVSQCAPCQANADCSAAYAVPALCLSGGAAGSFCVSTCASAADCGAGLVCTSAPGTAAKVCLPPAGVQECTCSAWAIAKGTSTSCEAELGKQLCPGSRSCTASGLSDCAQTPASTCVDTVCKGSKNGSLCDDGDGCTTNNTCQNGLCSGGKNVCECKQNSDCTGKNDANLCNGSLFCELDTNTCKLDPASVVDCSATQHGPCETVVCQPATGKCLVTNAKDGGACDDEDPCTVNACKASQCAVVEQVCACQVTADCKDDGDLCNGTPYCDKAVFPYACKTNPASIKTCPASSDPCLAAACDKQTGTCGWTAGVDGVPCEDGSQCTSGDNCLGGACASGALTCSCTTQADCLSQDDGNFCNGVPFCNLAAGKCQINPASVVSCPSANDSQCQVNRCQAKSGQCAMQDRLDGSVCDDDNPCTANETCQTGTCAATADICECKKDADCPDDGNACNGVFFCDLASNLCQINPASVVVCDPGSEVCAPIQCDPASGDCVPSPAPEATACEDGEACTALGACKDGSCVAGANLCQCDTDADCTQYENGNLCDGTLYCDKAKNACVVNPATLVFCDPKDNTTCLSNRCQPKSGECAMTPAKAGVQCEDGNPCTANDKCEAGSCETGLTICLCQTDADCIKYDDANLCNGTFFCSQNGLQSTCLFNPASVVTCDKSLAPVCNSLSCTPATGLCDPVPKAGPCEDGSSCTLSDQCAGGKCLAGQLQPCDDSDPCTFDLCISGSGCTYTTTPDSPCNDGEVCTKNDRCKDGACGGEAVVCSDNDDCLDYSCVSGQGCNGTPTNNTCSDGNPCTTKDLCASGSCIGEDVTCNDDRPCTDDSCNNSFGNCVFVDNTVACEDGDVCTTNDTCGGGSCVAGAATDCNDGLSCTTDSCAPLTGCAHTVEVVTSACFDHDECSVYGLCQPNGTCSGPAVWCDDGDPQSVDSCVASKGCQYTYPEACDGLDNNNNDIVDDVSCGGSCVCLPNGEADCPETCTSCPDPYDVAIPTLVNGVAKVQCAHDFRSTGVPVLPNTNFVDNGDGTVIDSYHALMWQKYGIDALSLADATSICMSAIEGGQDGWRLPTLFELSTLTNYAGSGPTAMMDFFEEPTSYNHISATKDPKSQGPQAEYFRLAFAGSTSSESVALPDEPGHVRCVRALETVTATPSVSSLGRFVPDGGAGGAPGTVFDKATQLTWAADPVDLGLMGGGGFTQAAEFCNANLDGLPGMGWRLPTIVELQSLLDRKVTTGPRIAAWAFPNTPITTTGLYWSSTVDAAVAGRRWAASFITSASEPVTTSSNLWIRCVRP